MENRKLHFFIVTLLVLMYKTNAQTNSENSTSTVAPKVIEFDIEKIIIGDINNDKVIDTAFVKGPKFINNEDGWGDCTTGNCEITISFSCGYPSITMANAVAGFVENIGDIDKDGIAEIIIVPSWFIGCWGQIHFYTLKKGNWKNIGNAKRNICREESFMNCIKKMKGNKIKVMEEIWVDGDVVEKPKIISVK